MTKKFCLSSLLYYFGLTYFRCRTVFQWALAFFVAVAAAAIALQSGGFEAMSSLETGKYILHFVETKAPFCYLCKDTVIAWRARLDQPGLFPHLKILNSITPAKEFFFPPFKLTHTGKRQWAVVGFWMAVRRPAAVQLLVTCLSGTKWAAFR